MSRKFNIGDLITDNNARDIFLVVDYDEDGYMLNLKKAEWYPQLIIEHDPTLLFFLSFAEANERSYRKLTEVEESTYYLEVLRKS